MDNSVEIELNPELYEGEKLIWAGRPKTGFVFYPLDIVISILTLIWLVLSTYIFASSFGNTGFAIAFFILPFGLGGGFFLFGRFWLDSVRRRKTIYGISGSRIIIKAGIFKKDVNSFPIDTLPALKLSERENGRGSISFGEPNNLTLLILFNCSLPVSNYQPRLELIENAPEVYQLILKQQRG